MWIKKKPGDFLVPFGHTNHKNSFPEIRSDPFWASWPFKMYCLIYPDKFNFDA